MRISLPSGGTATVSSPSPETVEALDEMCEKAGKMREAKVFRMNDFDWWAGFDLATVVSEYSRTTEGVYVDEVRDEVRELTAAEMDSLTWVEDLAAFPEGSAPITFRERLAQLLADPATQLPCFFASTEY